jgi:hypothetical protein
MWKKIIRVNEINTSLHFSKTNILFKYDKRLKNRIEHNA